MKRIVLLLAGLFVVFLSSSCGPSDTEKRALQVVQAKDDALKLRQQLAQAKSGADAENLRQQMMKVLSDAGLTLESIHFTDAELTNYVKAASGPEKPASPPPPPKKSKAARHTKARRKG
jgi:ABC-type metal ion transport system substrate-binding protein